MKKIFLTLLSLISLLQVSEAWADSPTTVQSQKALKYGIWDTKPYSFKQENGKYSGLDIEIFELLLSKAKLASPDLSTPAASWSENLQMIKDGKVDVIGGATETKERKAWANFSDAYRNEEHVIVTPKNKNVSFKTVTAFISYLSNQQLNPTKIGIVEGISYNAKPLRSFLAKLEKTPSKLVTVVQGKSYEDVMTLLMNGAVDMALVERVNAAHFLKEKNTDDYTVTKIGAKSPQRFIFRKDLAPGLLPLSSTIILINQAIKDSKKEIDELTQKYIKKQGVATTQLPEKKAISIQ